MFEFLPSGWSVDVDGCKLIGSAQRRTTWGFLQHGSIRLSDDSGWYRVVLGQEPPPRPSLPHLDPDDVSRAIVAAFQRASGGAMRLAELTPREAQLAEERTRVRCRDPLCAQPLASSRFPGGADRLP